MNTKTCMGCKHYQRVKIRGQWSNVCGKSKTTAPMLKCGDHEPRFDATRKAYVSTMGTELL